MVSGDLPDPVLAPSVTTRAATSLSGTGATLNGDVTPNGLATNAWFEWGTDPALASPNTTDAEDIGSGTARVLVSQPISGLADNTTYYFRVASQNSAGTSRGRISPFYMATSVLSQKCVTYQIDTAHSGHAAFGLPLVFPASPTWRITLGGVVSYPLIANGKVYVITRGSSTGGYGTQLYALDLATGDVSWGPVAIPGTYFWSGHAYDNGKIFVVNYDGVLWSFDAADGTPGWSTDLPYQYSFSAPPTAANGIVYVGGAGSGGTLYAVDEQNGAILWTSSVTGGHKSSPTLSDDGLFVSYPCQVYKFNPFIGAPLWHYNGPCFGGGGKTPAYSSGLLYVRGTASDPVGTIFNADSGSIVGNFGGWGIVPIPAFGATAGFFQMYGTLQGVDPATMQVNWSFAGDGQLVSAPIVIDQVVIVGSASGSVYALDAASGSQIWSGSAGAVIYGPDEQNVSAPLTGLGAGEGYLIVPAGNTLAAWLIAGQ
jgi:outer membrane protein assembly factor BamB